MFAETQSHQFLVNHFLIAMPIMGDPHFSRSVTLICQHDENGAMGVVINQPLNMTVGEVLEQLEIAKESFPNPKLPIYSGGPVQTSVGLILHTPAQKWESTLIVSDELALTTSKDILNAMAHDQGPAQSMLLLGYAGWSSGQLEEELTQNTWLTVPASSDIIFNIPPEQRWSKAAELMGVNIHMMSAQTGHA